MKDGKIVELMRVPRCFRVCCEEGVTMERESSGGTVTDLNWRF